MLFKSQIFLTIFLPFAVIGYYLLAAKPSRRMGWILFASLVFCGSWDVRFITLLLVPVVKGWLLARLSAPSVGVLCGTFHMRFLAPLAYHPFQVPAGLSLYPIERQLFRTAAIDIRIDGNHDFRRFVALVRVGLCPLGRMAWTSGWSATTRGK